MDEFDTSCEPDMPFTLIIAETRSGERQHGPQPFSSRGDDMPGQLRDQGRTTFHFFDDQAIYPPQIFGNDVFDRIKRGLRPVLARIIQANDNGQAPYPLICPSTKRHRT